MGEAEDRLYDAAWDATDRGDYESALEIIDRLLEERPDSAAYWVTKAGFLEDAGDPETAESAARQALRLNPRNEHAWSLLGRLLAGRGLYKEGLECFKRSLGICEDFAVHTLTAALQIQIDNLEAGAAHAQRALELNPSWEEARLLLDFVDWLRSKSSSPGLRRSQE